MDKNIRQATAIRKIKNELENVVNDYNEISQNFASNTSGELNSQIEIENQNLEDEIDKIQKRINDKLSSLSEGNKFQDFLSNYLNTKQSNADVETSKEKNVINLLQERYESEIDVINENKKNKLKFIEILFNEYSNSLNKNEAIDLIKSKLEQLKNDFYSDMDYIILKHSNDDKKEVSEKTKQKLIDLHKKHIDILENELINYINFNDDFLDDKQETITFEKEKIANQINHIDSILEDENSKKFAELEQKLGAILDIIQNSKSSTNLQEQKLEEIFDKKLSELEDKFNIIVNNVENKNSNKVMNELTSFFDLIKDERNEFLNETRQSIQHILKNNENEKSYIIELLNKIQEDNYAANDEISLNRALVNSERLHELENLIVRQNDELEQLLDEKNTVLLQIEKMISSTKEDESNKEVFNEIESKVQNIIVNFDEKISSLEKVFVDKVEEINSNILINKSSEHDEIVHNINSVEEKLIQNYETIKNDFNQSFNDIIEKINNTKNAVLDEKIDSLIDNVNYIKSQSEMFDTKTLDLKEEIKSLFSKEFNDEVSNLIYNKINDSSLLSKIDKIENKLSDLMNEINNENKSIFSELSNKVDNIDYITKTIYDRINMTVEEYDEIEEKLMNNFKKYEEILMLSISKNKDNYNEVNEFLKNNYSNREEELSDNELTKLGSLNTKLENLKHLIELQENEIQTILKDKDFLISLINSKQFFFKNANTGEMEQISKILEDKVENCLNRFLNCPENLNEIQKSNDYNELTQINDKIDEFSNYLNDNISFYNSEYKINDILEFDLFKNFSQIDFLIDKIQNLQEEIQNINLADDENYSSEQLADKQFNLNKIKFNLLDIELDINLIKHKIEASQEVNNSDDENRTKDLLVVNKKKLEIIDEIIQRNKEHLKNLFDNKDQYIKEVEKEEKKDFTENEFGLLIDTKANLIIDKLVDELKVMQANELEILNDKFFKIQNKLLDGHLLNDDSNINNVKHLTQSDIDVMNLIISKFEILKNNLKIAFDSLEEKNKKLLSEIENQLHPSDICEKIISKFNESKEMIRKNFNEQIEKIKSDILNYKSHEIERFKSQLFQLENEIESLKSLHKNEFNDEEFTEVEKINSFEKISDLQNKTESLILQLNSFQEDKYSLYESAQEKIDYINNLESESEYENLELDDLDKEKFADKISNDAMKIMEEKFDYLNETLIENINNIATEVNDFKEIFFYDISLPSSNMEETIESYNQDLENMLKPKKEQKTEKNEKNSENIANFSEKSNKNENYYEKNNNSSLNLINDNILFFVKKQEKKNEEITLFYKKLNDLKDSHRKSF